jgi:hypothetical protein
MADEADLRRARERPPFCFGEGGAGPNCRCTLIGGGRPRREGFSSRLPKQRGVATGEPGR